MTDALATFPTGHLLYGEKSAPNGACIFGARVWHPDGSISEIGSGSADLVHRFAKAAVISWDVKNPA